MDIAVCIDRGYVMPTGVMAYSVCKNNQDVDATFHIICDESVSAKDKEDLYETICGFPQKHVVFYSIDSHAADSFPRLSESLPTTSSYYRLFLTMLLPDTIEKVLYLDGDLVVRRNLLPLWNTDLTNYAIAAVPDKCSDDSDFYNRLQYSPVLGYINAGVLLVNLRYWRDNNVIDSFVKYIQDHYETLLLQDQDVLNYVFREKKLVLPLEYNFQQDYLLTDHFYKNGREFLSAVKDPVILHFSGVIKPWFAYIRDVNPLSSSFYKYQKQTKWVNYRIERRSPMLIIKNFLADIMRMIGIKEPLPKLYVDVPPID